MKSAEYASLLDELLKREKALVKQDNNLRRLVFFDLLYDAILEKTNHPVETLLYVNRYLMEKLAGDLKILKTVKGEDYFTINGGQLICAVKVPEIVISGRVFREAVTHELVPFSVKNNVVRSFIDGAGLCGKKKKKNVYNYIITKFVKEKIIKIYNNF